MNMSGGYECCGNCRYRHELVLWNETGPNGCLLPNYDDINHCCTMSMELRGGRVHQVVSEQDMCEMWEEKA